MKALTIAAGILLAGTCVCAECVVVAPETRPSHRNARAIVTADGRLATHLQIRLEVTSFPSGKKSELQLPTDARGAIDLKRLPLGQNCLSADAEPRLVGSFCLDVTATEDKTPTEFPLALTTRPPEPTLEELAKQHDKSPIELSGPAFVGTVQDQSGAGIPKAEITVYRRDSASKPGGSKVQADDQGNFTAALEPGTYTIVVMSLAFRTRFVGVEINRDAPKQNMAIELKVGSC